MNRTHLLLSVLVSVLMPAISLLNNVADQSRGFRQIMTSWVLGALILFLLWWANLWISRQMKLRFRQNVHTVHIWVFQLAASLLMIALFIGSNLGGVRMEAGSHWWVLILRLLAGATMIIGIQVAVDSSGERQAMRIANIRLQNENLEARFELLKQQINPHFLFNALSTLRIMVRAGDPHAEQFTLTLSDLYRQLLNNRNATTVSLSQELTFLRSYLFMLKSRFEDRLEMQLDMLPESETRQIPAFALQLLVENCIKHNVISSARPLKICIYQSDADSVTVENTIHAKPVEEEASGIGLHNLRNRYELLGMPEGVLVHPSGDRFRITLKLL